MAKYCPVIKEDVLYLYCRECEDRKACRSMTREEKEEKKKNREDTGYGYDERNEDRQDQKL